MNLTYRQKQVLFWLIQGHTNKEIGKFMNISDKGVKYHLTGVFKQYGVKNRLELLRKENELKGLKTFKTQKYITLPVGESN